MDSLKMLEHYKNTGNRVDEVLFHTVTKELGHLRKVIDQKNFSIDLIGDQKLEAQKENRCLREALEYYADTKHYEPYCIPVGDYASDVTEDNGEIARQALQGGKIK
ncbi:hypothetical protein MKX57_09250 [Lysinibacillus sp. FSL M8-0216]|uniref:hypothetical protein n=1 Tax=Lysinibacillus sp. FSL M8-0216 TaxID=2921619 RepID=UPI00315AAD99